MPTHYCTEQDLIDRFGEIEVAQLTNRSGVEVIDDSVLGRAQDDADEKRIEDRKKGDGRDVGPDEPVGQDHDAK